MDRFFKKYRGLDTYQITALDRLAFLGDRTMGALTFEPASASELEPHDMALLALAQDVRDAVNDKDDHALQQLVLVGARRFSNCQHELPVDAAHDAQRR